MTNEKKTTRKTQQLATKRIFTLIEKLRRGIYTRQQLQLQLPCSKSSFHDYINFLKGFNYNIEVRGDVYVLVDTEGVGLKSLSEEEKALIQSALNQVAPDNPLKQDIHEKLFLHEDYLPLADNLVREQDIKNIDVLTRAIRLQKRVILRGYQSTNSNRLSDRVFKPKTMYDNYWKVHGCEVDVRNNTSATKTFNIERVGTVIALEDAQCFALDEQMQDVFGWSGTEWRVLELRLSKRAKLILEKDHPKTRPLIKDDGGGKFFIRAQYAGVEHISRFILSLPNEIEVLNDSFLRAHLNDQLKLFKKF